MSIKYELTHETVRDRRNSQGGGNTPKAHGSTPQPVIHGRHESRQGSSRRMKTNILQINYKYFTRCVTYYTVVLYKRLRLPLIRKMNGKNFRFKL